MPPDPRQGSYRMRSPSFKRRPNNLLQQYLGRRTFLRRLHKPKKRFSKRLIAIINSGFFLWVLSAAALSIGGTYYVQHKECLADAARLVDKFENARKELNSRENYVRDAAFRARNIHELKEMLKAPSYVQADFRNYSHASLLHDLWVIARDAGWQGSDPSFPERADLPIPTNPTPEWMERYRKIQRQGALYSRFGFGAGDIYSGHMPPDVTDADLSDIREFARIVSEDPVWRDWSVAPNCSFQSELRRLILGTPLKAVKLWTPPTR